MINQSHMLGAFYGMERMMGRDHTCKKSVRLCRAKLLEGRSVDVVLTVTTAV